MKHLSRILCQFPLAAIVAAWLVACGPGVGGTGTGESGEYLPAFGAAPRALCDAVFAAALDCAGTQPGEPAAAAGTLPVTYVDAAAGGRIHIVFDGNAVLLDAPCLALKFRGAWGAVPQVEPRFFGLAVSAAAPEGELAQLTATPVAASPGELRLLLQAADGRVIVGPFVARPVVMPALAEQPCR